jgi:ABC-type protease/lipase transport system fused ATPase/permease subunit
MQLKNTTIPKSINNTLVSIFIFRIKNKVKKLNGHHNLIVAFVIASMVYFASYALRKVRLNNLVNIDRDLSLFVEVHQDYCLWIGFLK